jgi:hypothetical protein
MDVEQDDFDKKASALYLWYLKYIIEYIDEEIQRKETDTGIP